MSLYIPPVATMPMRLPMPVANPFEGAVVGQLYKDAIAEASVGDTLKCVHACTGPTYFIEGNLYPVVRGTARLTMGELIIKDEEDVEVPYETFCQDLFVLVKAEPVAVLPEPAPTTDPDLVEWAIRGLEAEYADLNETYDSFLREKNNANKFDSSLSADWANMSREEKADLLLAQHEDRKIQWCTTGLFGSSTWMTLPDSDFSFVDTNHYRLMPAAVESYDAEMKAIRVELDKIVELLREYRSKVEDDDVWSCDW